MLEHQNDNLHEPADGTQQPATTKDSTQKAIESICADNAESSEQFKVDDTDEPQIKVYEQMNSKELLDELNALSLNYSIKRIYPLIENIKKAFKNAVTQEIEEQKQDFLTAHPEFDETDFEVSTQVQDDFDDLVKQLKDKKTQYNKDLQEDLHNSLEIRQQIIEQIKELIESKPTPGEALTQISALRDQWKAAGPIPKDKYNHVWNNYHFQMERFYDQLDLNREARDLDFKFNLEQKQRIIARAKELFEEQDIIKAYRELQTLHRIWREEIGPVEKEYREAIWEEFSEISKELHEKREALLGTLKQSELENLGLKVAIISEIDKISKMKVNSHNQWQGHINMVKNLRDRFFVIGNVPLENSEEVWQLFNLALRNFNSSKNSFYKVLKSEQQKNLRLKLVLIEKAKANATSNDFVKTTPIMKSLQTQWKKVGHVPKKQSDAVWNEFRGICNTYFDRMNASVDAINKDQIEAYARKKEYLGLLRGFQLSGDHKTDLNEIKNHISIWKTLGNVPHNKKFIEGKFNKLLDTFFTKLSMSRKESEILKYNHHLDNLAQSDDMGKIKSEIIFNRRKLEDINHEILQLQNNLAFIQNPSKTNPLVKEVHKSIQRLEDQSQVYKEKLEQLNELISSK